MEDYTWLENAIVSYIQNNENRGGQRLNSLDIITYFKQRNDITFTALRRLVVNGRLRRVDTFLNGWNGNHYYELGENGD